MKKLYILSIMALIVHAIAGAQVTYYVSASGDDLHDGLSASTPWKTITKLNNMMSSINEGDSVLFKRGDEFIGEILPVKSGTADAKIYFDAYGIGEAPVINGAAAITGWIKHNGNIWVANYSGTLTNLNNFFINGISQQVGRYPNADATNGGYARIQRGAGNNLLIDAALNGQNWTGGTAVVRVNLFLLQKATIQTHRKDSLTLASPGVGNYTINTGYGYFVQNHLSTLDQQGEWYFDRTARKIYLYSLSDPNTLQTEAPVKSTCFLAIGKSYLSIKNLSFKNSNDYGIRIDSTAGQPPVGVDIENCFFSNCHNAILVNRAAQVSVANNEITNTNNNAIFITARSYDCSRNRITRTALRAGMGDQANNQYNAINFTGSDATATNNYIDSVGYCGIRFEGRRLLVKNNRISHFAMVKADVGGIYSFKGFAPAAYGYGNNVVSGNIISDAYPNLYGTTSFVVNSNYSCGIYMDNSSSGNLIKDNTIFNVMGAGLMVNITTSNHTIRDNTFFNNMYGFGYFPDNTLTDKGHRIVNNIFYAKQLFQQGGVVQTGNRDYMATIGTIDSNHYRHIFEQDSAFVHVTATNFSPRIINGLAMNRWRSLGYDEHSDYTTQSYLPVTIEAMGPNRISNRNNSQFDGGLIVGTTAYTLTPAAGTNKPSWDNTGVLDGGCLQLDLSDTTVSKSSRAVINIGTLTFGKYYRLKFTVIGNSDTAFLNLGLLSSTTSNFGVCKFKSVPVTTTRREVELLYSPSYNNNNTALSFTLNDHANKVWIDNIEFSELTASEVDTDEYVRFEVNPTAYSKTIDLGTTVYKNIKGAYTIGSITLDPYSSIILEKQDPATVPFQVIGFSGSADKCMVRLTWNTRGEKNVKHYEVEYSTDGVHFNYKQNVLSRGSSSAHANEYAILTNQANQVTYYRLKVVNNDNSYSYCDKVRIVYDCSAPHDLRLYPNPAYDHVMVSYEAQSAGQTIIRIINVNGQVMNVIDRESSYGINTVRIDVSAYAAGTYFVRVESGLYSQTAMFVK